MISVAHARDSRLLDNESSETTKDKAIIPQWVYVTSVAPTERGERTRQRIILGAENLFRNATSYDNIGIADIARESKISVGTIYRYFDSKEDLLHVVISNAFWRMYKASRGVWRPGDAAVVNLQRTTLAYLEAFWEERSFLRLARQVTMVSSKVRDTWWSMKSELRHIMQARLEQDQSISDIPPLDPEITLRALLGMVDDYAERAFIDEEYGPISKQDIPKIASVLGKIWFRVVFGTTKEEEESIEVGESSGTS
jgi:AcrR family transcriptional regulator